MLQAVADNVTYLSASPAAAMGQIPLEYDELKIHRCNWNRLSLLNIFHIGQNASSGGGN